jgi:LacI family transcriptional regulator
MGRVTIKEVARIAGVSPSAVSIAMNGKSGISEQTRAKILQIVDQMGYTPNENSRRLLFNRTNNILILMDNKASILDQVFYSELNNQLLRECEKRQYSVVYSIAGIEGESTVVLPKAIKSRDVDGIIVMKYLDPHIISQISSYSLPIVIIDNYLPIAHVYNVVFDYRQAAVMAMEHLVECGHKNIGYIGSDTNGIARYFSQQTFTGYKQVLEKYNLAVQGSWMQANSTDEVHAALDMDRILNSSSIPTAVLCSGDIYAIGAMRSIKAHNLKIPDDISVIGIDDVLLSQYVEPALTTVRLDRQCLAEMAVELLISCIEQTPSASLKICHKMNLVERVSVKRITGV